MIHCNIYSQRSDVMATVQGGDAVVLTKQDNFVWYEKKKGVSSPFFLVFDNKFCFFFFPSLSIICTLVNLFIIDTSTNHVWKQRSSQHFPYANVCVHTVVYNPLMFQVNSTITHLNK